MNLSRSLKIPAESEPREARHVRRNFIRDHGDHPASTKRDDGQSDGVVAAEHDEVVWNGVEDRGHLRDVTRSLLNANDVVDGGETLHGCGLDVYSRAALHAIDNHGKGNRFGDGLVMLKEAFLRWLVVIRRDGKNSIRADFGEFARQRDHFGGVVSPSACENGHASLGDFDGNFEAILSADDHNGNWLRIQGDHPTLVVRHFFYNWETEKASSLQIERVGDQVEPADRSVDLDGMVSRQLYALGDFVHDNLKFFLDFNAGPPINGFMPPIDRTAIGAAAENRPVIGRFELEPDEALILEVEPPNGVYWSYSIGNQWWETIHYGRHQSSLNAHQAHVDSDGVLRVVISSRDPGVANWLDAAGHSNGAMILRCVRTESAPTPTARVVKFADVGSELPAGTKWVTEAERAAIIEARRRAVHERFSA